MAQGSEELVFCMNNVISFGELSFDGDAACSCCFTLPVACHPGPRSVAAVEMDGAHNKLDSSVAAATAAAAGNVVGASAGSNTFGCAAAVDSAA